MDLRDVALSLGAITELFEQNIIGILLTDVLGDIVADENWEWDQGDKIPLLRDIRRHIVNLFQQEQHGLVRVSVSCINSYCQHPIPGGEDPEGLFTFWADELGRILALHDSVYRDGEFHFGIACHQAFAGKACGQYSVPDRALPLVGHDCVQRLGDAYLWELPDDISRREVSFRQAKKNCSVLGASKVASPSGGGSHYRVIFPGQRTWILDRNNDPLPERFLRQLEPITNYPIDVIKYALTEGKIPNRNLPL